MTLSDFFKPALERSREIIFESKSRKMARYEIENVEGALETLAKMIRLCHEEVPEDGPNILKKDGTIEDFTSPLLEVGEYSIWYDLRKNDLVCARIKIYGVQNEK